MPRILAGINWLDILFIILLLGMSYRGTRTGVGGQVLSLAGWVVLVFVPIAYYDTLSAAIFGFLLQKWAKPISFFVLSLIVFIAIKLAQNFFSTISVEGFASSIEKTGGAVVACFRGFVLCGLIGMFFLLIPSDYMYVSVTKGSRTSLAFIRMNAGIYSFITNTLRLPKRKGKYQVMEEFLSATLK